MISLEFNRPVLFLRGSLMKISCVYCFVLTILLSLPGALSLGQPPAPPATSQVAVVDKSGKEAVCDGALEIIPSGQVTFARKRYVPKTKVKIAKPRSNVRR
jgi:hypothetical protein